MDSVDIEGTFAWTESSIITFGLDRQKKTRQEEDMALLALLLLLMQQSISASIYPVASELWIPAYQKTEKMFATDQGPVFARTGNSSITVLVRWRYYMISLCKLIGLLCAYVVRR